MVVKGLKYGLEVPRTCEKTCVSRISFDFEHPQNGLPEYIDDDILKKIQEKVYHSGGDCYRFTKDYFDFVKFYLSGRHNRFRDNVLSCVLKYNAHQTTEELREIQEFQRLKDSLISVHAVKFYFFCSQLDLLKNLDVKESGIYEQELNKPKEKGVQRNTGDTTVKSALNTLSRKSSHVENLQKESSISAISNNCVEKSAKTTILKVSPFERFEVGLPKNGIGLSLPTKRVKLDLSRKGIKSEHESCSSPTGHNQLTKLVPLPQHQLKINSIANTNLPKTSAVHVCVNHTGKTPIEPKHQITSKPLLRTKVKVEIPSLRSSSGSELKAKKGLLEYGGMAFQATKVNADLTKLTPAPDRPRIFMSNKTSKVVVVFPNGDVVEGLYKICCCCCCF